MQQKKNLICPKSSHITKKNKLILAILPPLNIVAVLRPANEYNIKEKIKLANQESFAIPTPPSPKFLAGERRVTFRDQLVDYEPDDYSAGEEEEPDENGGSGSGNNFRAVNGMLECTA